MNAHPDLLGLLRGELGNADAIAAGNHLASCISCQQELADAVVGHALLVRASATLGPAATEPAPLPPAAPRPARRRRTTLLVAAAAVVAVGATAGVVRLLPGPGADGDDGVEAALSPASATAVGDGSVRMVEHDGRTRMSLAVHDLPHIPSGEFYYAWLLDPATNKMLPLGLVDPTTGATFDLDDALVSSYSAVDVSLEADDGDPAHSVTSVLRGTYEPDQITTAEGKQG